MPGLMAWARRGGSAASDGCPGRRPEINPPGCLVQGWRLVASSEQALAADDTQPNCSAGAFVPIADEPGSDSDLLHAIQQCYGLTWFAETAICIAPSGVWNAASLACHASATVAGPRIA